MAIITLFSPTRINPVSEVFYLHRQVTVSAVGMDPGDTITFEVLRIESATMAKAEGCCFIPAGQTSIFGTQTLMCPKCEPEPPDAVTLSDRDPVVVLDHPQGSYIRAVYNGTGLMSGTVMVTAQDTQTPDLTMSMRGCKGCCVDVVWVETGEQRCTDTKVERQEISNCGNYRWVETEPVKWTDTCCPLKCSMVNDVDTEKEQANQCGHTRWVAGPPQDWQDTGSFRCISESETEKQQVNQCGRTRWVAGPPVKWTDTGALRCVDGSETVTEKEQRNQCGDTRWVAGPAQVWRDECCPLRCATTNDVDTEKQQVNQCGLTRWVAGPPQTWVDTGSVREKAASDTETEKAQQNDCGGIRWVSGPAQTWTATGAQRCANGLIEGQEVNQFGRTRWTASTRACVTDEYALAATVRLPCGYAYGPTGRDPAATEELQDCKGEVLGFIYPTPRAGATTPVVADGCKNCSTGKVVGYAVDKAGPNCSACGE